MRETQSRTYKPGITKPATLLCALTPQYPLKYAVKCKVGEIYHTFLMAWVKISEYRVEFMVCKSMYIG